MKITVRPHGRDVQRRFEALRAEGIPWSEASEKASSFKVNWPTDLRLPVPGDSLHIESEDISRPVARVTFILGEDDETFPEWSVEVKLE